MAAKLVERDALSDISRDIEETHGKVREGDDIYTPSVMQSEIKECRKLNRLLGLSGINKKQKGREKNYN